jgi:hypothetical protein
MMWRGLLHDIRMLRYSPDPNFYPFIAVLHDDSVIAFEPVGIRYQSQILTQILSRMVNTECGDSLPIVEFYAQDSIQSSDCSDAQSEPSRWVVHFRPDILPD